ncbi:conserved hypothetical protein [Desulfatibacillum aliphaticivorans]|uniref:Dinitrogenase iron-molybdenum cofactor biosynthesis domain-containing protein n=1 Tax=Desulfatibacillum aliphaticivorans TaxID=218208 RepID=B8FIG3_DESAL|nr:NifB/NifX family molybdenum-iron cluster-binding protein [Desulfatibacillum aliphaticivorans]ACL03953.1 conserved hypothetical protein [Desulfatibacillum aliphaticivorans]
MRIALSIWNNRISPVFDVARQVLVLDVEQGEVVESRLENLPDIPGQRLAALQNLQVRGLVCGAISEPLAARALSVGIEVMPFVAGDVDEIVNACVSGALDNPCFAMPGCQGLHRYYARACTCGPCERRGSMPNQNGTGPRGKGRGQGGGQGQGQGRRRNINSNTGKQDGTGRGRGKGSGQGNTSNKGRGKGGV